MGTVKPHLCKNCGEEDPIKFASKEKSTCKVCRAEYHKKYAQNNRDKFSKNFKTHYRKNKDGILIKLKDYNNKNKESIKEYQNSYQKNRKIKDPSFKLLSNLRVRHSEVLKGVCSSTEGLGCDSKYLRIYISSKFTEGMTFENYGNREGQWSIDHILPLTSYEKDANGNWCTESEYNKELIHYTNLQPMWQVDNIKKSNKICYETF